MIDISDKVQKIKSKTNKLKVLSFFSGAMGLDIGLEKAGLKTYLACEVDKSSRKTIVVNKPDIGLIGDIRNYSVNDILKYSGLDIDDVDVIVGGPPCQAFSSAGKRKGFQDERGNVFLKYLDVIEKIRPTYIVIENVRGIYSTAYNLDDYSSYDMINPELKGSALYYIITRLQNSGYNITFNLYNAANYGSPQIRERIVILGTLLESKISYLTPTHSKEGQYNLPAWRTIKDVFNGLPKEMNYTKYPEKRIEFLKKIPEGGNWKSLSTEDQKKALGNSYYLSGGKTGFLRRLSFDKPSPTLVTSPIMPATDLCHPLEERPLSIEEYKRIQEFPDDWKIMGKISDVYKQIGNAVPVSLGYAIGKKIIEHHSNNDKTSIKNFKYSRYKNTSDTDFVREYEVRYMSLLNKKNDLFTGQ